MKPAIYLFIIFTLLLSAACASNDGLLRRQAANNTYFLSGEMSGNTYRSLIEALDTSKGQPIHIVANSNGGWITGIDQAMDAIRSHGQVYWEVPRQSVCYSACALLGIAAQKINGTLQFHSPSASYNSNRYMMAGKNEELIEKIISYGYERETTEKLLKSVNIFSKLVFVDGVLQKP